MELTIGEYDIVKENPYECLSQCFTEYKFDKNLEFKENMLNFCRAEKIRLLCVIPTTIVRNRIRICLFGMSGPIYKLIYYDNKCYLHWFPYKDTKNNSGYTRIPICFETNGSIKKLLSISNRNEMQISDFIPGKMSYETEFNVKIVEEWLEKLNLMKEFIEKNDCFPYGKTGPLQCYTTKIFKNFVKHFEIKMGVMSIPYVRKEWILFYQENNKLLNRSYGKSQRKIIVNRIKKFFDLHGKYPSMFSIDNDEKDLGQRLHKYIDGDEYLKEKMLQTLSTNEITLRKTFFENNISVLASNFKLLNYEKDKQSNYVDGIFISYDEDEIDLNVDSAQVGSKRKYKEKFTRRTRIRVI